jgi:hypothetical protein
MDEIIAEAIREGCHAIVPIIERPYFVFTVGMEELYGVPELLLLCDELDDPMVGARYLAQAADLVKNGADATAEGEIIGTVFSIKPAEGDVLRNVKDLMGTASRYYAGRAFRVSLLCVDETE